MAKYHAGSPPDKPSGDWRTIRPKLRRAELRRLRNMLEEEGEETDSIREALALDGEPALDDEWIGIKIRFTFAQYKKYGQRYGRHPSTIRPYDENASVITKYLNDNKRQKDRISRALRRAEQKRREKQAAELDDRRSAILTVLSDQWMTVGQLMRILKSHQAFKKPNGKPLAEDALRQAVHRCLKAEPLVSLTDRRPANEKHGLPMLWVRRRTIPAVLPSERINIGL
jgi:hypothetical protein